MSDPVRVYKKRKNVLPISLGFDVSGDTITSEIRTESGVLIATWLVEFDSDGTDGELILTLDDSDVDNIQYTNGIMDLKRVAGVDPWAVFNYPLEVEFIEAVTQ